MNTKDIVLKINNLSIGIQKESQKPIVLVEDVNFYLYRGETFGLIGESGCGKTITSLAITGILPEPHGIFLNGEIFFFPENKKMDILKLSEEELKKIRGSEIGVIFQEPSMALNPLYTIQFHFEELYTFHKDVFYKKNIDFHQRTFDLLKRVGFSDPEKILKSYPHQLSGGMLQRIVIVLALLLKPTLVIADEPTTALDVTIQAQIMELLDELKQEENTTVLLITHNMGLLAQYSNRLAVMYAGRIVELTDIDSFLENPLHPYSIGLLNAIPDIDTEKKITGIPGNVPSPENYIQGCRFFNRCSYYFEECNKKPEPIYKNNHVVYCWKYKS